MKVCVGEDQTQKTKNWNCLKKEKGFTKTVYHGKKERLFDEKNEKITKKKNMFSYSPQRRIAFH